MGDTLLLDAPAATGVPEPLDPDPTPGPKTRRRPKAEVSKATAARQPRAGGRFTSSAGVKKQVADELHAYAKMFALGWSVRDPECGGVLNDQSKAIADSLADLVARSDWLLDKFTTTTLLADCMKAAHAVWPVLAAMARHGHFSRARDEDEEEVPGVGIHDDATAYPAWRPDETAYPASRPGRATAGAVG